MFKTLVVRIHLQWNGGELGHTLVAACRTKLNLITAHIEQKPISTNGLKSAPIECAETQLFCLIIDRHPTVGTAEIVSVFGWTSERVCIYWCSTDQFMAFCLHTQKRGKTSPTSQAWKSLHVLMQTTNHKGNNCWSTLFHDTDPCGAYEQQYNLLLHRSALPVMPMQARQASSTSRPSI